MNTTDKVMSWLEGLAEPDWRDFHSDSEVQNIAKSALELLKSQRETIDELISDGKALKLLKEQEPTTFKPHYIDEYGKHFICGVECGSCHEEISRTYHYCPYCGKAVKWE